MIQTLMRRAISLLTKGSFLILSKVKILYSRAASPKLHLTWCAKLHSGSLISATDGGSIVVGKNVSFGRHSQVIARGGKIVIGDNVQLGSGCVVVAINDIRIGSGTLIAEYVVIRDQDHQYTQGPIRMAGFNVSAIAIGADCWLGSKATVLRGVTIGDGAVIGAHGLVRSNIPAYSLACGCPARVIKNLPRRGGAA